MKGIFFDLLCISANRKAAQISLHRFRRTYIALIFLRYATASVCPQK